MRKLLLAAGLLVILSGCQKNQLTPQQNSLANKSLTKAVSVDTLKAYLGKLTTINVSKISYNADSKQFAVNGKDQIGLDVLTNLYNQMPLNQSPQSRISIRKTPLMLQPPPCDGCDDGGGDGGGGYTPPPPSPPPYFDPADSLNNYSNTLINYFGSSSTINDDGTMFPLYTDITQGAIAVYSIAVVGPATGSLSGNTLNVPYNQSQTVKVTMLVTFPHDPVTGKVSPFQVTATLGFFTTDVLSPTYPPGSPAFQITQANVKPTDVLATLTFNYPIPVATSALQGQHFCLYWNNSTSNSDEKFDLFPVYTINVTGAPTTAPVVEQTGPIIYLYRMLYNPAGEHFYTTSNIERNYLLLEYEQQVLFPSFWTNLFSFNNPTHFWTAEDNIGKVWNTKAQGTVPLYRLFNGSVHMYTIDPTERDNIIANLGYHSEGISGYVYPTAGTPGTQAVHRYRYLYSNGGHFFTPSYGEIGDGSSAGFTYEGIAFYTMIP